MKITKCDVCGRTEPEIFCGYIRRKKWWGWFKYDFSNHDSTSTEQDVCDQCWARFQEFVKLREENIK